VGWGRPRRSHEPPPLSSHRRERVVSPSGRGRGPWERPPTLRGGGVVGGASSPPPISRCPDHRPGGDSTGGSSGSGTSGPSTRRTPGASSVRPRPTRVVVPSVLGSLEPVTLGPGGGKLESNLVQSFCCRCCAMHVFSNFGRLEPPLPSGGQANQQLGASKGARSRQKSNRNMPAHLVHTVTFGGGCCYVCMCMHVPEPFSWTPIHEQPQRQVHCCATNLPSLPHKGPGSCDGQGPKIGPPPAGRNNRPNSGPPPL